MTPRARGWRDEAAAALVLKHLDRLGVEGPVLVMEDPRPEVRSALEARLPSEGVTAWHRRALGNRPAAPWPPPALFGTAFLRLPKARDELEMAAHAAAHRLAPEGRLFVYGAKDEGAGSAAGRLESAFGEIRSVATGGRCRLVEAGGPLGPGRLRAPLEAWRIESPRPHPLLPDRPWISYPGVFAAGRLDDGTALLLETLTGAGPGEPLPRPPAGRSLRVLDFGCGDGVIGAVAGRGTGVEVAFLDVDAVALAAVRENVPGARTHLSDGLSALGEERFDLIVANPPYHRGKAESTAVVEALVRDSPAHLDEDGAIRLVVQRRLPVQRLVEERFRAVEVLADRGAFRVWWARTPEAAPS